MKSHILRGLVAALFVVVGACGGGSSDDGQLTLKVPRVEVSGLATGDAVTVQLQGTGETLNITTDGIRYFAKTLPSGHDHTVVVAAISGTTCLFANGTTSSTLNDPAINHVLNCGSAIPTSPGTGGGSSGGGSGGAVTGDPAISLALTDSVGQTLGTTDNPVTSSTVATLRATLTAGGVALGNQVVAFQTTIGELDPASGTALTDGNGIATIKVLAGDVSGAGTLTATATVDGQDVIAQYNFQISSDGSSGGGTPAAGTPAMGNGTGVAFQDGVLAVSTTSASAGSTVNITANVVDTSNGNAAWSNVAEVTFTSACANGGTATIDSTVTLIGGTASAAYTPQAGCTSDTIAAGATISGQQVTATSPVISVQQAPANSIAFVNATPSIIGLKGSGQAGTPETSTLTFEIRDSNGQLVGPGTSVDFNVVAGTGGFSITSGTSSSTNSSGRVSVTVASGSVPTVGTVRAVITGTGIEATGSVSVQTGIASQERFSVAVETLNPIDGEHLGTSVKVSARAADRFGNWVPDGTQINFTTELGDIDASCQTVDGGCSVTWTSQGPQTNFYDANRKARPASECFAGTDADIPDGIEADKHGLLHTGSCGAHDRFGRSTITAWTVGEEAFEDTNGNNLFDEGETWTALPEAFRDDNETGTRTSSSGVINTFMDFNEDGGYDTAGSAFRGLGCTIDPSNNPNGHCEQLANVRDSAMIVIPTDALQLLVYSPFVNFSNAEWVDAGTGGAPQMWRNTTLVGTTTTANEGYVLNGEQLAMINGSTAHVVVVVADLNGNAPPAGTTITAKSNTMDITGPTTCTVANTTEAVVCSFDFFYTGDIVGEFLQPVSFKAESGNDSATVSIPVFIPPPPPAP